MRLLLNFLGIVLYFLMRYNGRTDKAAEPSVKFWFDDNWPELLAISIFDVTLMLLLLKGGIEIDLAKYLPDLPAGVSFVGDLAICFLIGLVLASAIYNLFKTKVRK